MTYPRRIGSLAIVTTLFLVLSCLPAHSQSARPDAGTDHNFWPEWDTTVVLPDHSALITGISLARNRDSGQSTWEFEEDYQRSVAPLFRRRILSDAPEDNRYVTLLCGFAEFGSSTSQAGEHRGILAATGRLPLPGGFLLDDRNRLDLRGLQSFSWRYRNRLAIRHGLMLGRLDLTPYASAESYYDSASGRWNRFAYRVGTVIPVASDLEIEPYFEHQRNSGTTPEILNAVGVTLTVYLHLSRSQ